MSESGSSRSIDWWRFRELIEPPSVPASPRSFCTSLDIGSPVRSELKLDSVALLVLRESVDIILRKVLPSVNSFGLFASTPMLFFLDIDLDLVEDGSIATLQSAADVGERSVEEEISSVGPDREAFFDFVGQRGRDTNEGCSIRKVWRSSDEDVARTELRGVEEAGGVIRGVEIGRDVGGETGHGAICWPQR